MDTIKTVYSGNLCAETEHPISGVKIITSSLMDDTHQETTFSPTDLVAIAFSSCALTIMGMAAQTHGFNIDGAVVSTTKVMASNPRRIVELIVNVQLPHSNYTEKEQKIIETSLKTCPVANTIQNVVKITQTISYKSKDIV
jgi:uncharacterized OsmC-like protein